MKSAIFRSQPRGFTLIELLIVVAIISILAVVVVVVLNPAEVLRLARDSNRHQHLFIINRALRLQQVDQADAYLGNPMTVYVSLHDVNSDCSSHPSLPALPMGWSYQCSTESNYRNDDGTGWVPVDFALTSFQPLFSTLPIDPINDPVTGNYYTYVTSGSDWEINGVLTSDRYQVDMANDGGDDDAVMEVGTNLNLVP